MKITDVTMAIYEWPRPRPIRNGRSVYSTVALGVVRVHTDAGLTGLGLGGGGRVGQALVERLRPLLIGEDPLDHERLWHRLWQPKLVGRRGSRPGPSRPSTSPSGTSKGR